jgi:DNA-directed RNA polymerase specialized sigma24 family protein
MSCCDLVSAEDVAHFMALLSQFWPRVYAYDRRQGNAELAEEVVAETFTVAWRRLVDVPPKRCVGFSSWRARRSGSRH